MNRFIVVAALVASSSAARAAPVPRGERLEPAWASTYTVDLGPLWGVEHALGGRRLIVDRRGYLTIDASLGPQVPRPLSGVDQTVVAPFWAPLDRGGCRVRPPQDDEPAGPLVGHVEHDFDVVRRALTLTWVAIPRPDCSAETTATFAAKLRPTAAGGLEVTFTYEALPGDGAVAPRAGVVVRGAAFELLPDGDHQPPDRGKALLTGSSDGVTGVWTFEVGGDGALVRDDDPDGDGVRSVDNCEQRFNPLQENLDVADEPPDEPVGDICDSDDDSDLVDDAFDNCPRRHNSDQRDVDGDGIGDVCDDDDGDGVLDIHDRCPTVYDPAQLDLDRDGRGDACDRDIDGDDTRRLFASQKNGGRELCPYVYEIGAPDADGDGIGDGCDASPWLRCSGFSCIFDLDSDGDGWIDLVDLCPTTPDLGFAPDMFVAQRDADGDGDGDRCDPDADGDGILDIYQQIDRGDVSLMAVPMPAMGL